ncbi:MAG: PDZ domain-containing protein [Bacteriovoracaceae bacterium]|nr:PDZ domain-containing protein [Bacteriovoracaceae bacterium]
MKDNSSGTDFCMKQFKPIVGVVLVLLLIVVGWTVYIELGYGQRGSTTTLHARGATRVAAFKIPIRINMLMHHVFRGNNCYQCHKLVGAPEMPPMPARPILPKAPMTHPFWGKCTNCHKILGAPAAGGKPVGFVPVFGAGKIPIQIGQLVLHPNYGNDCMMCHMIPGGDQKPAIPADPIQWTIPLPHPFWGACKKCHAIIKTPAPGAAPVAFINSKIGKNYFGADLLTVDRLLAEQFNLPSNNGVLVNSLKPQSYAATVGFLEGDIITDVNNIPVTTLAGFAREIDKYIPGDRINVKVIRNKGRTKNLKFKMKAWAPTVGDPTNKIGILATGKTLNSPVAFSLVNAPYMIVYELDIDNFYAVANPFKGIANNKVSSWIVTKKVGSIVTGNINQSDFINLQRNNVTVYNSVFGTAADAVALYRQGDLIAKKGPQVVAFNRNIINILGIPSNYADPASNIAPSLETAQYLIKVELDQNMYEVIINPYFNQPKVNGLMMAHFLVDNEFDALITNKIGNSTLVELKKLNVQVINGVNSTVSDAILNFQNGKL